MGNTCLSVGARDPWVVASSSYMRLAAILGGPAESTVLASVNAFYVLHCVRFGGPSAGGLCATGLDHRL